MPIDPKRVAAAYLNHHTPGLSKTAGEVRFIKDRSGDKGEWAWGNAGPSAREMQEDFSFRPNQLKPLAKTLQATLMAMGHAQSAANIFTKIQSAEVSPDGNLGGKGYIQKIADMRRQYANVVEALSAMSDTLHDELHAPHWHPDSTDGGVREREEVIQILDESDDIRKDPEGWAGREEEAVDSAIKKQASVWTFAPKGTTP